jgi:hypothetical protein
LKGNSGERRGPVHHKDANARTWHEVTVNNDRRARPLARRKTALDLPQKVRGRHAGRPCCKLRVYDYALHLRSRSCRAGVVQNNRAGRVCDSNGKAVCADEVAEDKGYDVAAGSAVSVGAHAHNADYGRRHIVEEDGVRKLRIKHSTGWVLDGHIDAQYAISVGSEKVYFSVRPGVNGDV